MSLFLHLAGDMKLEFREDQLKHVLSVVKEVGDLLREGDTPLSHRSAPPPTRNQTSKRGCFQAIPTIGPRGIQYRSRIEAKWAYMFETLEWEWNYEPEDSPYYIPDFCLILNGKEVLVEIKSSNSFGALKERFNGDYEKAREGLKGRKFLLLGGNVWSSKDTDVINKEWREDIKSVIGLLWDLESVCVVSLVRKENDWQLRTDQKLSDHRVVSKLLNGGDVDEYTGFHKTVQQLWSQASNKSQWNPP